MGHVCSSGVKDCILDNLDWRKGYMFVAVCYKRVCKSHSKGVFRRTCKAHILPGLGRSDEDAIQEDIIYNTSNGIRVCLKHHILDTNKVSEPNGMLLVQ
jgi:hypothetical protein